MRILKLWEVYLDLTYIRPRWFAFSPDEVLSSHSFGFLKMIIDLYQPAAQPWEEEQKYCDLMISAALIRRIELRRMLKEHGPREDHL